ncbi:hypothetical protein [Pantoea rwandensis]|nr:hypothetical protein [Pantoea rwandensis]
MGHGQGNDNVPAGAGIAKLDGTYWQFCDLTVISMPDCVSN